MKQEYNKGISLITLVITIIVMVTLATVTIVLINSNNIIGRSKESIFKYEVALLKEELLVKRISLRDEEDMHGELEEYIDSSLAEKYKNIFSIIEGELELKEEYMIAAEETDEYKYAEWAREIGIVENYSFEEAYGYIEDIQELKILYTGLYKLEAWGASRPEMDLQGHHMVEKVDTPQQQLI